MITTTVGERLAEIHRHIHELEARARAGAAEAEPPMQRHVDALRQEEAAVVTTVREAPARIDAKLTQLEARLEVAENSLAADGYETRWMFTGAVEAELHSWDAYFERLQTTAAARDGEAREQAEAALRDLRARRLAIADRLEQLLAAPDAAWLEEKQRVSIAREELERKADELSSKLRGR